MTFPPYTPRPKPVILATRGSALALAQTRLVLEECRAVFPEQEFEIRIIKTTGDNLQSTPPDLPAMPGTKGLFTKELETALLNGEADFAVHSLKDLPTDLPDGLDLSAVLPREDARDVLVFRETGTKGSPEGGTARLLGFPPGVTVATSSTRRQAQLLALRPDLKVAGIRGNVGTRLQKLADRADLHALILAAAGLRRLQFDIGPDGKLSSLAGAAVPAGLAAAFLSVEEMVPCVGQGAIGIEGRQGDAALAPVFARLNDPETLACVLAERAFLRAIGGGCLSPVAAYAELLESQVRLRAVSFRTAQVRKGEGTAPMAEAEELGVRIAAAVRD